MPVHDQLRPLSDNAAKIVRLRYLLTGEDGQPIEDWHDAVMRVASNVAAVECLWSDEDSGGDEGLSTSAQCRTIERALKYRSARDGVSLPPAAGVLERGWTSVSYWTKKFYGLIGRGEFMPNSPTWTGAGTPLGQLAACFVLPITDDLGEGRSSIFETLKVAALIQQTGGGNGFAFSNLRPKGARVSRSGGQASGPVGFLRIYDAAFGSVAQGGTRRGANMAVLRCDHPDVFEFIDAKVVEGEIANFNISVGVTDEFMTAVRDDLPFDLRFDGKTYRTIQARELWDRLIKCAWTLGDPGVLFLDRANAQNPNPDLYVLEATNPCGEQYLPSYSNCCLGSLAVNRFVDDGQFNWDRYGDAVATATRFLDDVVEANAYVNAIPELVEAAMGERRIGLGIMGLADTLALLGLGYNSPAGRNFAEGLMEFTRMRCMQTSIQLAAARGPFEWFKGSVYDSTGPNWSAQSPAFLPPGVSDDPDWWEVIYGIDTHGIRNACQLTIAPTGTISNVADCEGSGCEPFFALSYVRTVMQEGENIKLPYLSSLFLDALRKAGVQDEWIEVITQQVQENRGSCWGLELVPTSVQMAFPVAADISPADHVQMQAVLQKWVDNSISKTINMPKESTVADVAEIYDMAHRLSCKGITIYRQDSRQVEVLSTKSTQEETVEAPTFTDDWPYIAPRDIPHYAAESGLPANVYPVKTFFGTLQVIITHLADYEDRPFDVRLQLGKAGNDKNADVEAIGRMISLSLRLGAHPSDVVDQLAYIGGATVHGFGPDRVRSVADAVAKLLRRLYLDDLPTEAPPPALATMPPVDEAVLDPTMTCPNCGQASVVMESGCRHCDMRLGGCGSYNACD
jgi:ribonucleoside-diphosphate reductase alpha chain